MIDHQAATEKALTYLKQSITDATQARLEEIEKSRDGSCWVVTFGCNTSNEDSIITGLFSRKYKQVSISVDNGDFVSIKSRVAG